MIKLPYLELWTSNLFCVDNEQIALDVWGMGIKRNEPLCRPHIFVSSHYLISKLFLTELMLKNKTLTCGVYGRPPFVIIQSENDATGTDVQVVKLLAEVTGFKLKLDIQDGWYKEDYDENGTFTGMSGNVGVLMMGTVQLASGEINLVPEVSQYLDWMFSYYVSSHFKTAKPNRLPPYMNMTQPFSINTWIASLGTLFVVSALFSIFLRYYHNNEDVIYNSLIVINHQFRQCKF